MWNWLRQTEHIKNLELAIHHKDAELAVLRERLSWKPYIKKEFAGLHRQIEIWAELIKCPTVQIWDDWTFKVVLTVDGSKWVRDTKVKEWYFNQERTKLEFKLEDFNAKMTLIQHGVEVYYKGVFFAERPFSSDVHAMNGDCLKVAYTFSTGD